MKRFTIYILLLILLVNVGCSHEEEMQVEMPFSLCLPATEVHSANHAPMRRVMGDPGKTEHFALPHYLYIIVLKKNGVNWELWDTMERTLKDADWLLTHYNGTLETEGDSIYQYTGKLNLLLSNQKFEGRVYAIASAEPLTLSQSIGSISSLSDVLNLTFSTSSTTMQENLQHIYTTPYNYIVSGDYYGSFNSAIQRVPHVSLMLYHVAAKVDIKWNVEDSKRIDKVTPANGVRLTYMEVRRLYNGEAYCFRPLRNEMASLPSSGGYDIPNMVKANDEGLWWEGRTYFYTIPYVVTGEDVEGKVYFPLQMLMRTNGSAGTGYQPTLNMRIDTTAVFVPWMRANFNLTQPLENKSETKTIDG